MVTFGYTTAGTSGTQSVEDIIRGSQFTTPAGGPWTVDKLSAYYNPSATQFTTKAAIYTAAGALVANSETSVVTGASGVAFRDFVYSGAKPVLSGNTSYILVIWSQARSGTNLFWFDPGVSGDGKTIATTYGASFPATLTFNTGSNKYSIYATMHAEYALSGGTPVTTAVSASKEYNTTIPQASTGTWGSAEWGNEVWAKGPADPLAGAVAVQTGVAAALSYTRHGVLTSGTTVTTGVAGTVQFGLATSEPSSGTWGSDQWGADQWADTPVATIAGGTGVQASPGATLVYARNAVFVGNTQTVTAVSGVKAYGRHVQFDGAQTITITSVAASTRYNRNASVAGSVSTSAGVAASVIDFSRNATLNGTLSTAATPAAAQAINRNPSISGACTAQANVSAAELSFRAGTAAAISGTVTVIESGSATLAYNRNIVITGSVPVLTTVAGSAVYTRDSVDSTITGTVSVVTAVSATTAYNRRGAISGQVPVSTLLSAQFVYNRNASLSATVGTQMVVAAVFDSAATITLPPQPRMDAAAAHSRFVHMVRRRSRRVN